MYVYLQYILSSSPCTGDGGKTAMATTTMTTKNRTLLMGAMRDGVSSVVACVGS
jgi:hypothetical protein